jgi:hypothetical protein
MKQLTEKQAGCLIGRLRPCHVVCHLNQSRLVGRVCLCCKRPNTCKQSRKRSSCANFSEMLYISHSGVTMPTTCISSQFRGNVCVVVCQTERPRDSTTEKHRSTLCLMWLSPIASWDPRVRHVMSVECKAHLPRGPAFQCRQWTIAEALHTQDMRHIRCFAAYANKPDASVVLMDVTLYD